VHPLYSFPYLPPIPIISLSGKCIIKEGIEKGKASICPCVRL
jgi:hypothetical protein